MKTGFVLAAAMAIAGLMVLPAGSATGALGAALASPTSLTPSEAPSGPSLPSGPIPGSQAAGAVAGSMPLSVLFFLNDNEAALDQYLAETQNPASPEYRTYVSASQFGSLFGAPSSQVSSVVNYLRGAGLGVAVEPDDFILQVTGTASELGEALHTSIDWFDYSGERYYSVDSTPAFPPAIAPDISTVLGLSSFSLKSLIQPYLVLDPNFHATPADEPVLGTHAPPGVSTIGGFTAYGPQDLQTAYNVTPLYEHDVSGQHVTVAIAEWLGNAPYSNIAAYNSYFGLPEFTPSGPNLTFHYIDGASTSDIDEVDLDIDAVHSMAPQANVSVVSGCNPLVPTYQIADIYNYIYNTLAPSVQSTAPLVAVSTSWGMDTQPYSPLLKSVLGPLFTAMDHLYKQAAAMGVTSFVSSGDSGSYNYSDVPNTSWPALDPYITAVGGTTLLPRMANGTLTEWDSEEAWGNVWSDGTTFGSGGGTTPLFKIPSWQSKSAAVAACAQCSKTARNEPDVAANANFVSSPFWIYDYGFVPVGGTSESSPIWAGIWATLESLDLSVYHRPLSWGSPLLYAAENDPAHPAFHPITVGTNGAYSATGVYNLVDGLGSPNVTNLATDLTGWNPLVAEINPGGTVYNPAIFYVPPSAEGYWSETGAGMGGFDFCAESDGNWSSPQYSFNFGDGTGPHVRINDPCWGSYAYASPGTYHVTLTVTNNSGTGPQSYSTTTTVWATPTAVVDFCITPVVTGTTFTLNGQPFPVPTMSSLTCPAGNYVQLNVPASTTYNASTYTAVVSAPGHQDVQTTFSLTPTSTTPPPIDLVLVPGSTPLGAPSLNASYHLLTFSDLTGTRASDPAFAVTGASPAVPTMPLLPFNQTSTQWFPAPDGWVTDFYGNNNPVGLEALYTTLAQPFNNYIPEYSSLMQSPTYGYQLYTINNMTVFNTPVGPDQLAAAGLLFGDEDNGNELEVIGAALGANQLTGVSVTLPGLPGVPGAPPIVLPLGNLKVGAGPVYAFEAVSIVNGAATVVGETLSPVPLNGSLAVLTDGTNDLTVWNNFALHPSATNCGGLTTPCATRLTGGPILQNRSLNLSIPGASIPILLSEFEGRQNAPVPSGATDGPYSSLIEGLGVWQVRSQVKGTVTPTTATVYVNGNPVVVGAGGTFDEFDTESNASVTVTAAGYLPQEVLVTPPLWGSSSVAVSLTPGTYPTSAPVPPSSARAKLRYFENLSDPTQWWTDWAYPASAPFGENWFITPAGLEVQYNGSASPLSFEALFGYSTLSGSGLSLACTTNGKGHLLCPQYGVTINYLSVPAGGGYNAMGFFDPSDGNEILVANLHGPFPPSAGSGPQGLDRSFGHGLAPGLELLFYNATSHTTTVTPMYVGPFTTYSLVVNGRGYIALYNVSNFGNIPLYLNESGPIFHELDPMLMSEFPYPGGELFVDEGLGLFTF